MRLTGKICSALSLLLAVFFFTTSVHANLTIPSFPYVQDFQNQSSFNGMLQINPSITRYEHSEDGWSGRCVKLYLQDYNAEDSSGLGGIYFPANTTRLNMRWLQKYGPDFINLIQREEWKLLIFRRGGASRLMVLDWHRNTVGNNRTLRPCLNIDCVERPNLQELSIDDYLGEWISIEVEIDTAQRMMYLYIATLDGRFDGSTPFASKAITSGAVDSIDIWAGYWEGSNGASNQHYIAIDELKFDTQFIGPPAGFGTGTPPTTEPPTTEPPTTEPPTTEPPTTEPPTTEPPTTEPPTTGDTGLPWESNFESNSFNEWNGGARSQSPGDLSIVSEGAHGGQYCARATLTQSTLSDNYADLYFGDHRAVGKDKVEEVYLQFHSKFESGYVWPNDSNKMAIFNLTDGESSQRRYQVYVYVRPGGEYKVAHSYIDSWQFFGLDQNVGSPASVRFDQWDKLKLYAKLNTPGVSDGVVKLWVNDELKLVHEDVNIRQNTDFGIGKLILSSYVMDTTVVNGYQYYDDWIVSLTDPDPDGGTDPDPLSPPGVPGPASINP
jgi:Polysaccharide lyase